MGERVDKHVERLWASGWITVRTTPPVPAHIVKVTSSEIKDLEEVAYCAAFTMTPEQFCTYWKNVRPIFASDFHDYSFGACYFKASEQGKEFLVGVGSVGIINKGDRPYYYVDKNAKSELSGLD
ncbi:hypothetical protein [Massilia aquatica]|uniref:GNAT family N-acetyltransferase n=1 Tax=Massilia aquatica TaxID=2609000 RepID=A0ABX0MDW8_9BURK|nr:hypothetical protein [Massilia aquatica]NHZ43165.1 hypothetical protein [Massilia aquatica]